MKPILEINPHFPEKEKIEQAAQIITRGGVIGYPTETVYGLGADIFCRAAVKRIFEIKGRNASKAIIVIVPDIENLQELVTTISDQAHELMQQFWPGALTLIFPASDKVPAEIRGGGSSIAIRIPDNKICLNLLKKCQLPLTSTSANFTGEATPVTAQEVNQSMGEKLDLIIDGGPAKSRTPSTILDITTERFRLIRQGALPIEKIERICKIE